MGTWFSAIRTSIATHMDGADRNVMPKTNAYKHYRSAAIRRNECVMPKTDRGDADYASVTTRSGVALFDRGYRDRSHPEDVPDP
jgi:hypothetical protein